MKYLIPHTLFSKFFSSKNRTWSILFFGADEFSLYSLRALLNEYRNRFSIERLEVCTSIKKTRNVVQLFAEQEKLKIHAWPAKIPEDEFDTGIVVSFGHLIPREIIEKFPLGILNVHASLLPRWRGAAPIIYSLANGDTKTGITIMKIKPKKFDIGEIVDQKSLTISKDDCLPELHSRLGILGANALVECLADLPSKIERAKPQSQENITYAPKITAQFASVVWKRMTSVQIYNLQRALTGLYILTTTFEGECVKLFNIKLMDEVVTTKREEGFIIYDDKLNLLKVVCNDRKYVSVEKIQFLKKKIITARDFNNGYLKKTGEDIRFFV